MKIVSYSYFLEHKNEKHSYKVEIVCKDCHDNIFVSWQTLCNRKPSTRYQQICTKCIHKYKSRKSLKGFYYDIRFDSSFELGFIHHCITNNIFIERFTKRIDYVDEDGKSRTYNPDFLVDKKCIIEIKGINSANVKLKAFAAKDFFKNNYVYKVLFLDDLKKLSNYIVCNQTKDLILFNQDKLKITSYPESFSKDKIAEPTDYIGFVYEIVDYIQGTMICDICYGKSTQEMLNNLIENDTVHKKIQVLGYGQYKYDLVHLKNLTIEKLNHLPRTPTEEETKLYKEKYHLMNVGENNPMYQQYWDEEKRQRVGAKLKGKNLGANNGMFGKPSTMLGKKDEKSVSGYDYNLIDLNGNVEHIQNTFLILERFNLTKHELNNIIHNHSLIDGQFYLKFTARSKRIYEQHRKSKHSNNKNKGGRKVRLFSADDQLLKTFPTITAAVEELKFNKKKIVNNKLILNDGRYIICDDPQSNKIKPAYNAKKIDFFDKDWNFVKTMSSIAEIVNEYHVSAKTIKKFLDRNVLFKNEFYLKERKELLDGDC